MAAAAQSAFVCQYDGMNETNRVAVKSVKVSGPNRPVVTTNIHHLNKNGKDARIDFLAGETSAPMVGYWDSVKKEGHLFQGLRI